VSECADKVKADFGTIDILVHSLANGPAWPWPPFPFPAHT